MSLAFADRDFYYGDPDFPPVEPVAGLLSKDYARQRFGADRADKNDADVRPGDPYPFQGQAANPFKLARWRPGAACPGRDQHLPAQDQVGEMTYDEAFLRRHDLGRSPPTRRAGWSR